jgi:1,4-alpha-glucan branching enzyme
MQNLKIHYDFSTFGELDSYHFKTGTHFNLYNKLGSHQMERDGKKGVYFGVWAPSARYVSVVGDFNGFDKGAHPMEQKSDGSGVWECFIEDVEIGTKYKYWIESHIDGYSQEKSDPYAFYWEVAPNSATKVWNLDYEWNDSDWMGDRAHKNSISSPISVYEVHIGSWKRIPEESGRSLTYREMADDLTQYVKEMGFTHVEFLPVTEHPYHGSWGYQAIGFFAPTSRFGTPQDFMYLIDTLHQNGIGVILDWVPSHFAVDMHGLARFDGSHLYEHADHRQGFHPEWGSCIFNLGRNEVINFLISSALFWFEKYHIDGIRVDAVASMLYLDYARKDGEWVANEYGGKENLEAVKFLQTMNHNVYAKFPDVMMIAEESTNWPMVTKPTYSGGLGFEFKWSMGWMHDTLKYFSRDPLFRKYYQDQITFSIWYSFDEQYMLSLSHDEVVHMKGSLIGKMNGDYWQKFANLRLMYAYMFAHPGKKLLFMGAEIAQFSEWNYESSLDWHLLDYPMHKSVQNFLKELHILYKSTPALYLHDHTQRGFKWVDVSDTEQSVLSFLRFGDYPEDSVLVVCNFTPAPRDNYRLGVPIGGYWREILNSDSASFGGSDIGNFGGVNADEIASHGLDYSLSLTLPPLGVLWLKPKNI